MSCRFGSPRNNSHSNNTTQLSQQDLALAWVDPDTNPTSQKAPTATSGDKVYVVGSVKSKQNLLTNSLRRFTVLWTLATITVTMIQALTTIQQQQESYAQIESNGDIQEISGDDTTIR